jgi:hypothetical protein
MRSRRSIPCAGCNSYTWAWRTTNRCDECPPSWGERLATGLAIVLVAALVLGAMAVYGSLAYRDWTCGFKVCVEVKP